MAEIKKQLENPVCIYEYSPTRRELVNISELVAQEINNKNSNSQNAKGMQCKTIFEQGIEAYQKKLENTVIVDPPSKVKKLEVRVNKFDLKEEANFWKKGPEEAQKDKINIFQKLANHVINQPYVDDPRELKDSENMIVYRPNHDVMHSMRKVNYLPHLYQLISDSEVEPWAAALGKFTPEEKACLELAVFLFRSGRTNEEGGSKDPSNAQRSKAIFQVAARQLEFSEELIASTGRCFDFIKLKEQSDPDIFKDSCKGFTGDTADIQQEKALLAYRIAIMSHDMDLVRTNSWRSFYQTEKDYLKAKANDPDLKNFKFELVEKMELFYPKDAERHVDDLLLLAKKSCEATGTVVHSDQFSENIKVSDYDQPIKDRAIIDIIQQEALKDKSNIPLKDAKSYLTAHVDQCDKVLKRVSNVVKEELQQQEDIIQKAVIGYLTTLAMPKTREELLQFTDLLRNIESNGAIPIWDKIKGNVENRIFETYGYRSKNSMEEFAKNITIENLNQFQKQIEESDGYQEYLKEALLLKINNPIPPRSLYIPRIDLIDVQQYQQNALTQEKRKLETIDQNKPEKNNLQIVKVEPNTP